ncbi:hypothetical protein AEQU3_00489 [Aequorivita antarctica]|nr:hypothetical protein AEQU3_00489 [Aequorivita antarctica]
MVLRKVVSSIWGSMGGIKGNIFDFRLTIADF